jgi:hypothetical protein
MYAEIPVIDAEENEKLDRVTAEQLALIIEFLLNIEED